MHLRSGSLTARIDPLGAELRSLRRDEDEFLWQDKSKVWPHSAPLLFPFVGRLKGGGFGHRGRFYAMPIHGFAAQHRFDAIEQHAHSVLLELRANGATRAHYPFDFCLQVRFTLAAHGLAVRYEVANEDTEPLAFALGSHPGCALGNGALEDWRIEFDQAEPPEVYRLDGELLAVTPVPFRFEAAHSITLGPQLFADDALIFKHLHSRQIRLVHRQRGVRAVIDTGGAPHLGLWARPGAAFVCIEPWFGVDEDRHAPLDLAAKPGLIRLAPGDRFTADYSITL